MMPWTRAPRLLLAATLLSALSAFHGQPATHAASPSTNDLLAADTMGGSWVWAWGSGEPLQVARDIPTSDPVRHIAFGFIHSLAVTEHGAVYAWGSDDAGRLGLGASYRSGSTPFETSVPMLVPGLPHANPAVSVAAGGYDSLALTQSGKVYAWGSNADGELGNPSSDGWAPTQVQGLPATDPVVAISAGMRHNLALTKRGHVYAWGDNGFGALGAGDGAGYSDRPLLVPHLPTSDPIVAIAAGDGDSLAVTARGSVYAWGWSNFGQTGQVAPGNVVASPIPVTGLPSSDPISEIAAGGDFSLALSRSGRVYAWGGDDVGQLAVGYAIPSQVIYQLPEMDPVTAIAAGNAFGLALTRSGLVYAWNVASQSAPGAGEYAGSVPEELPHLKHVVAISADYADSQDAAALEAPSTPLLVRGAGSDALSPLLAGWQSTLATASSPLTITYAVTDQAHSLDQWTAGAADFAARVGPLTSAQEQVARAHCGGPAIHPIHLPVAVGGVALTYNLPGLHGRLTLSPQVLARLLMGEVRDWGDADVQRLNPGIRLPHLPVRVIYRADASGATDLLTSYLSAVDPAWRARVGSGDTVSWPSGRGAMGSLGVAARVLRTPGAIGYVDLTDALAHHLPVVALLNRAGKAIVPGVASVEAAAQSAAAQMPADLQQQLFGVAGRGAYPLAGYLYATVCSAVPARTADALDAFLRYALTDGQATEQALGYAPLPAGVQAKALAALGRITSQQPAPTATPTVG